MREFRLYTISVGCLVASVVCLCFGRFWLTVALMASAFVVQDLAKREG